MTESHEGPRQPEEPTTPTESGAREATERIPGESSGASSSTTGPTEPIHQGEIHRENPTEPYPSAPQQPYTPNATVGNEAQPVLQPARYGEYAPPAPNTLHGSEQPPAASAFGTEQSAASSSGKRRAGVGLVAALAIGAVVGGVAGAGVFGLWSASNGGGTRVVSTGGAQTITVNNAEDATTATAVAAKASPSVVTIAVKNGNGEGGGGSGIVLSKDGYVLTNTHVVTVGGTTSSPTVSVSTSDGRIFDATIVGTDPTLDLAVIKLTGATDLSPMTFADSTKVNVGDTAVAIGAPFSLPGTVTDGIVSALNRSISVASSAPPSETGDKSSGGGDSPFNFDLPGQQQPAQARSSVSLPVIQTDASINPGNSGGALLNSDGQLIGVNVAIYSAEKSSSGSEAGSVGLGFAIPSSVAERVSKEIIANGSVSHGLLGASVGDSVEGVLGASIESVAGGGAASAAGLAKGDIITGIGGVPVTSGTDLTAQVRSRPANAEVELTYVRNGQTYEAKATLGQMATS